MAPAALRVSMKHGRGPSPKGRPALREHGRRAPPVADGGDRGQVEGRRAVIEALRAGSDIRRLRIFEGVAPSGAIDAILDEARARRVLVERVPGEVLDAVSATGRHQGVIAEVRLPPPLDLEELLGKARSGGKDPFLVVLDGLEDPQNVGAIARSAEAAGAHGLVLGERKSAGVSPGALRASAGALLLLPVAVVPNIAKALEWLKARGVWVAGTASDAPKAYFEADWKGPVAVVIGGESRGLHRLVRERCDFVVRVPLQGRIESLNASAAAAVVLFEAARQRAATPARVFGDSAPPH